jgi:RimJ/RimL family protein N-acetyltransferase
VNPFPQTATTDRLVLEPCVADRDLDGVHAIFSRPEVGDVMWPGDLGGARTREQTHAWLAKYEAHWGAHGFGMWTVRERDGGLIVAHAGLVHTVAGGRAEVEIGYVVHPDRWNRGYAKEITNHAIAHAFAIRGLESIVGFALNDNEPAMAVLRACGFELVGDAVIIGLDHQLFRRSVVLGPRSPQWSGSGEG